MDKRKTIHDRLSEEIDYILTIEKQQHKKILGYKALGALDMAVEFNLITYNEWKEYVEKLYTYVA